MMLDNNINKPWIHLSPNDWAVKWWRITEIEDEMHIIPDEKDIICYYIIQDGNMNGNIWHVSTWYKNCPNRYSDTWYSTDWCFHKELCNIVGGDIVWLTKHPDIQFKAYDCPDVFEEQKKFCKILERI